MNNPENIVGNNADGTPRYHNNRNGVRRNNYNSRTTMVNNSNPITRTFNAPQSPRYYKPDGQVVRIGAPLHQHQDGTIMLGHDPNNMGEIVLILALTLNNLVQYIHNLHYLRLKIKY